MNTNFVAVAFVSILLCGVVGVSVGPRHDTTDTPIKRTVDGQGFGGDISAFMQRGDADANGSVDSGMWLVAFETAENQSRKQTLVTQRATTLGVRLNQLIARIDAYDPRKTNQSVADRSRWVRLVADRNALHTSITEAKTTAAGEGVNASGLGRLDRRITNLTVPEPAARNRTDSGGANATTANHRSRFVVPVRTAGFDITGTTYAGP